MWPPAMLLLLPRGWQKKLKVENKMLDNFEKELEIASTLLVQNNVR
jgi:hypothetical protein